jgi:DNA-binding NtrC family response regulator
MSLRPFLRLFANACLHSGQWVEFMTPNGQKLLMLVDDLPAQQRLVAALASRAGWRTVIASDHEMAIAMLGTRDGMMLDAIIIDQVDDEDGTADVITELRSRRPALPIIVMTAVSSVTAAVSAMRVGAADFLVKPVAPERLISALESLVSTTTPAGELRPLTEKLSTPLGFDEIAGSDPHFRTALAIAAKAARARTSVLIEGEPGSGKQLVAEAIHAASPREKKPFVLVDCRSIPANLIDSELFGHEAGAFTGAFSRRDGKMLAADGGTLLLDDVGALPFETQTRLANVMETGYIRPVGGRYDLQVDVRLLATSDPGLLRDVECGRFREDLYYRLALVQVALPPLRKRAGDVGLLVRHLLARISRQPGMRGLGITEDAMAMLGGYDWPGNVRQLHDVLFRASALCDGDALTEDDFPQIASQSSNHSPQARAVDGGVTLFSQDGNLRPLDAIEADVIRLAIGHYRGRMTEVARRLGIGRSTLYRKLTELGISDAA